MVQSSFLTVANSLDGAGLLWQPEIGDEVSERQNIGSISILVDPQGMSPTQLRSTYLWLPTIEQLVTQIEARQAILFHTGLELTSQALAYKSVVQWGSDQFECVGDNLRTSLGLALREILVKNTRGYYH